MKSFESQILEESLTSGQGTGIDNPIAILRDMNNNQEFDDDEVFFYTKDHLGSIRELVGLDGKLKQRQRYSAYGVTTREKNTDQLDRLIDHAYGYTGRELDSETGLYFYRSRYYSAEMQRFVSEDKVSFSSGDLNLYRYVGGSPLMLTDPSGKFPGVLGGIIGAFAGFAGARAQCLGVGGALGAAATGFLLGATAEIAAEAFSLGVAGLALASVASNAIGQFGGIYATDGNVSDFSLISSGFAFAAGAVGYLPAMAAAAGYVTSLPALSGATAFLSGTLAISGEAVGGRANSKGKCGCK